MQTSVPKMRTPVPKNRTVSPTDRVLETLYENPNKVFSIRQLSKETNLPKSTIERVISVLRKEGMIGDGNKPIHSPFFTLKKTNHYTEKIVSSGVIDYLSESMNPSCIILFGSFRKGESTNESDIDLFVESTSQHIPSLSPFEKKLGHKIELFVKERISELPPPLFNNVVNGIKLYGYLKLK